MSSGKVVQVNGFTIGSKQALQPSKEVFSSLATLSSPVIYLLQLSDPSAIDLHSLDGSEIRLPSSFVRAEIMQLMSFTLRLEAALP